MIIDAFSAFNEIELANFRIQYLEDYVDKIVIQESKLTYSGISKKLYFAEWFERLPSTLKNKIDLIEVDLGHLNAPWDREIYTREHLMNYIKVAYPDHKFILSDLDEIPSQSQIIELKKNTGLFHFKTPTYYLKLNWALQDNHRNWSRGVMGEVKSAIYENGARFIKHLPLIDGTPGAHFSYLNFDAHKLEFKLISFAHTELQNASKNSQWIMEISNRYKIDHLGRFDTKGFGLIKITDVMSNDVTSAAQSFFPNSIDESNFTPNLLVRLFYSAKLTTYYKENEILSRNVNEIAISKVFKTVFLGFLKSIKRLISRSA